MSDEINEVVISIDRIQTYDPLSLARREELGQDFSFEEGVVPARKIIELYKQIPTKQIELTTPQQRYEIKRNADSTFNLLEEIRKFSPKLHDNPTSVRSSYIKALHDFYEINLNALIHIISYLCTRERDFGHLEHTARSTIQGFQDEFDKVKKGLDASEKEANQILSNIRKVAAEHGVSQQAVYFSNEAERHDSNAKQWGIFTILTSILLTTYAAASALIPKIEFLKPNNTYEALNLGISKGLVFAVIAYILFICARNWSAHRHNAIVNRHRQNALLTFKALADAANSEVQRDVVLTHAANCIFAPQETGYSKSNAIQPAPGSQLVEILPRITTNIQGSGT